MRVKVRIAFVHRQFVCACGRRARTRAQRLGDIITCSIASRFGMDCLVRVLVCTFLCARLR